MRQCTVKPVWIGHALKRRPYLEGQTHLIPSVFLSRISKAKNCKEDTASDADTKISRNLEKQNIILDIFVDFLKKKHFLHFKTTIFFLISICSFEGVQHFWLELVIFYSKLLSATNKKFVFTPLKVISTFKPHCTLLWTIGFSTVTYIKLWWSVKDLQKNALKIRGDIPL